MVEGCNCIEGCNCRNSASSPTVMMSPCSACLTSSFVAKISGFLLCDFAARILEKTESPVARLSLGQPSLGCQLLAINSSSCRFSPAHALSGGLRPQIPRQMPRNRRLFQRCSPKLVLLAHPHARVTLTYAQPG